MMSDNEVRLLRRLRHPSLGMGLRVGLSGGQDRMAFTVLSSGGTPYAPLRGVRSSDGISCFLPLSVKNSSGTFFLV